MGTVYARGSKLWLAFVGPDGKRVYRASGFEVGEEVKAKNALTALEDLVARRRVAPHAGVQTLASFTDVWIAARKRRGLSSASDDAARLRLYVLPELGHIPLDEVRTPQVRALFAEMPLRVFERRRGKPAPLAPRSVMNTYGALHRLFEDAVNQEMASRNPCVLEPHELPGRKDAKRGWRSTAIYTPSEVEAIISDARIPMNRRVLYALGFLTGMREGEIFALTWACFTESKPLHGLAVHSSYSRKLKVVKATKQERPRTVPVHPTLQPILTHWREKGWAELFGRAPSSQDLLIPNELGGFLDGANVLRAFYGDLETLGLRRRRFHDARRTFISLAIADDANENHLRWVTHGPKSDVIDLYTSLPWRSLCAAVTALQIGNGVTATVTAPATVEDDERKSWARRDSNTSQRAFALRAVELLKAKRRVGRPRKFRAPKRLSHAVTSSEPLGIRARRLLARLEPPG